MLFSLVDVILSNTNMRSDGTMDMDFIGNYSIGTCFDTVDVFEIEAGRLTHNKKLSKTLKLSQARSHLAATTVGNLAIFAGGFDGHGNPSSIVDVFEYNPNTGELTRNDRLSKAWRLSQARQRLAAATVGSFAVFGGGEEITKNTRSKAPYQYDYFAYDTVDAFWSIIPTPITLPPQLSSDSIGTIQTVNYQPNWFILNQSQDTFLVAPQDNSLDLQATRLSSSSNVAQQFSQQLFYKGHQRPPEPANPTHPRSLFSASLWH